MFLLLNKPVDPLLLQNTLFLYSVSSSASSLESISSSALQTQHRCLQIISIFQIMDPNAQNFQPSFGSARTTGMSSSSSSYYPHQQHPPYHNYEELPISSASYPSSSGTVYPPYEEAAAAEASYVYPMSQQEGVLFPVANFHVGGVQQLPITAIATPSITNTTTATTTSTIWDAIVVGTVSSRDRGGGGTRTTSARRSSIISVHDATDGSLYSSMRGQDASPHVLQSIYSSVYGDPASNKVMATRTKNPTTIPRHAYRPPYGTTDPALMTDLVMMNNTNRHFQMGIQALLPLTMTVMENDPAPPPILAVSPAGTVLQTLGGAPIAHDRVQGGLAASLCQQRPTQVVIGGAAISRNTDTNTASPSLLYTTTTQDHIRILDAWQGLRQVSSCSLDDSHSHATSPTAVTCLVENTEKGSLLAGSTDGHIRLLDPRRLRPLAKIKSHPGGVTDLAVQGNLIASTGFGSKAASSSHATGATTSAGSVYYSYPDPTVMLYDMRYLGRGGFPHQFAGTSGGPRFLSFLPPDYQSTSRLLVASGQSNGGIQIVRPFEEPTNDPADFILPPLDRNESITALESTDTDLLLGTSKGMVIKYSMAIASGPKIRRKLETPPFESARPLYSIEPTVLLKESNTSSHKLVFNSFYLLRDPVISAVPTAKDAIKLHYDPTVKRPMLAPAKMAVSENFEAKALHAVDFLRTVPVADIEVNPLDDHSGMDNRRRDSPKETLPNPNKFIYAKILNKMVYKETLNRWRVTKRGHRANDDDDNVNDGLFDVPSRYRLTLRPAHQLSSSFSHSDFNKAGLLPGWDYPPTMPNSFVAPVLMLLYLLPECRQEMLEYRLSDKEMVSWKDKSLVPELSFVFHRIRCLSRIGLAFSQTTSPVSDFVIDAWSPLSFVSNLMIMPEAEQLQILDGSPAATDKPRRPEAFLRFILYQIERELSSTCKTMMSLGCTNFISVNTFSNGGKAETSTTSALTIDLSYENFVPRVQKGDKVSFSEVLHFALCREKNLRAWNPEKKEYGKVVQRKLATSLPSTLSLSCACAGQKDSEGLLVWRQESEDRDFWLPEYIEVILGEKGSVTVRELVSKDNEEEKWEEFQNTKDLPESVINVIKEQLGSLKPEKKRYRLDSVLSMVRDDLDRSCPTGMTSSTAGNESVYGHHILHSRISPSFKKIIVQEQIEEATKLLSPTCCTKDTLLDGTTKEDIEKRIEKARSRMEDSLEKDEWILFNGYSVEGTVVEDVRSFRVRFKEPSVLVFTAVEDNDKEIGIACNDWKVPPEIMRSISISGGSRSKYSTQQRVNVLPGEGDLLAFDAEFVSLDEEESTLTHTGSKMLLRETRHAIARISVIDCSRRPPSVLLDDYVLPREPVVDYLTRFSGIVEKDLHPKLSPRHLISSRAAYLKIRCLIERGCIFVGHGLGGDFWTLNVCCPPSQMIDTLEIYHKPAMRYISLRFLTNVCLGRDMQQDTHDSIEDALAAYELYQKSVEDKDQSVFEKRLEDLYAYGLKTDWKLGLLLE